MQNNSKHTVIPNSLWKHIKEITNSYQGAVPLAVFLKDYYKKFPILGSRDRRLLSEISYSWYRVSKAVSSPIFEEKIALCAEIVNRNDPAENVLNIDALFLETVELSKGIIRKDWLRSMLQQPKLFLRIRRNPAAVRDLLSAQNIEAEYLDERTVALKNGTNTDVLLPVADFTVQDYMSQQTTEFFKPQKNESWFDCCCGAGGKSLSLKDLESTVQLTVSDNRDSILRNLNARFKLYGHKLPNAVCVDVTNFKELSEKLKTSKFDNIICDAPCTGSGTWARTPEQLYFFKPESIADFTGRQFNIVKNVIKFLKPDGKLFYITCSVFEAENEQLVNAIVQNFPMKAVEMHLLNGTIYHADSMFIAVLQRM
jgi:16S rRNA (cytosine967-C5)-methyltransferase